MLHYKLGGRIVTIRLHTGAYINWSPYISLGFWLMLFLDDIVHTDSCSGLPWIGQNNCMCSCFTEDHKNTSGEMQENNVGWITLSNNWTCDLFWQNLSVCSFKYFWTWRQITIPFTVPKGIKRPINFGTVISKANMYEQSNSQFLLVSSPSS